MATKDSSPTSRLNFQSLPSELRLQVYDNYFLFYSRLDAKDIYEAILPCEYKNPTLPLLLVNKQISEEVLDHLRKRKQYVYRITWQNARFDDLALSCLRARKIKCDDYANVPHLRLEIHPPHPDYCMTDTVNILKSIQELCRCLSAIDRLHHISIVFLEYEIASWSTDGKLRMSVDGLQELGDEPNLRYVLDFFAGLRNVTKATVELPHSVADDRALCGQKLRDFSARLERSMMNLDPLDHGSVDLTIELIGILSTIYTIRGATSTIAKR